MLWVRPFFEAKHWLEYLFHTALKYYGSAFTHVMISFTNSDTFLKRNWCSKGKHNHHNIYIYKYLIKNVICTKWPIVSNCAKMFYTSMASSNLTGLWQVCEHLEGVVEDTWDWGEQITTTMQQLARCLSKTPIFRGGSSYDDYFVVMQTVCMYGTTTNTYKLFALSQNNPHTATSKHRCFAQASS